MTKAFRQTKHHGPQECEACYRWTTFDKGDWICPFCGHDNVPSAGVQVSHANRIGAKKAAENKAKAKSQEHRKEGS